MKAKLKVFSSFLLIFFMFSSFVHVYITESPIAYPIPERCRRFSSPILSDEIPESIKQDLRKSVKDCFPQEFTFLIFKDEDIGTPNMNFKQGFSIPEYIYTFFSDTDAPIPINKRDFNQINFQRDCAIIGNSGILLDSKCGKSINRHDFVIRSNLAPIESYEEDVGIKTNITVLNSQIINQVMATFDQQSRTLGDTFLNRIRYLNDSILWYSKDTRVKFKTSNKLLSLSRLLKDRYNLKIQFGYSWKSIGPLAKWFWDIDVPHPTTGLNVFTVAASICNKITLYGFYPFHYDSNGRRLLYHYFDEKDVLETHSVHNMPEEYQLLKKLNRSGVLTLVSECRK